MADGGERALAAALDEAARVASEDLIWIWSAAEDDVLWANAAAERLCGRRRLAEFMRGRAPAPGPERPARLPARGGAIAGGLSAAPVAGADGRASWRMRFAAGAPAPEAGALTARVFERAAAPLAAADAEGRVVLANAAFRAAFGAASADPAWLAAGGGGGWTARAEGEPVGGRGFWLIEADPAPAPDVVSVEALARIAHDFRSPLTAVLGFAEFLRETAASLPPERLKSYLDDLATAAERMRGLADGLVALGAAGAPAPRLDAVVESAARIARPDADRRGARLEAAPASGLGLRGDAEALGRAVSNLIDNALKHAGAGARITAEARDLGPGEGAALVVADDGPGLSAEALAEARRAWGRPGPRPEGEAPGGLGLAIVAEAAAALDGRLEIETAPGRGFRASIRLPESRVVRTRAR